MQANFVEAYEAARHGVLCRRGSVCAVISAREQLYLHITDTLKWSHPNRSLEVRVRQINDLYSTSLEIEDRTGWRQSGDEIHGEGIHQHVVSYASPVMLIVELRVDGLYIPDTPIFVRVAPLPCAIKGQIFTSSGCACPNGMAAALKQCIDSRVVAAVFSGAGLLVFLLVTSCGVFCWARLADQRWIIRPSELTMSQPLKQVGHGTRGPVLCGDFRNMDVVVKAIKRPSHASSGGKQLGPSITYSQQPQLLCTRDFRTRMRVIT